MVKKSKGFGELLKQQRADKIEQKELEKLEQKVKQGPLGEQFAGMVKNPQSEVKMSEVLKELVEPYLDFARNHSQREKLFSFAAIVWNIALMPENERQQMIDQVIEQVMRGKDLLARQDAREIIDGLIARKQKLFADNKRYIIDFQLQDMGQTFHLSVASTLMNPPSSEQ
jgi:hypothetical protein